MTWLVRADRASDGTGEPPPFTGIGADYGPGALESTFHWQVIWPRVIAKAWEDPEFHAAVLEDPRGMIDKVFGYKLSGNLELTIEDAPQDAQFKEDDNNPDTPDDPWAALPPLRLTIVIPPAPEDRLQAVAITAYQDTGRTYPFTCC